MSELFDDDLADLPPRPSRRTKVIIGAVVLVVLLFFGTTTFAGLYTDGLWYHALRNAVGESYGSVFDRLFWTKTLLFVATGLVMGLALAATMVIAFRTRPFYSPADEHSSIARYREAINPIRGWLTGGVCVIAGVFAGISGAGQWRTFMLWRHAVPFGQTDPYFGKDIGFYVFTLPWWHYVVDFVMATLLVALFASVVVHYLYGGIRLASIRERVSAPAQTQISVLAGSLLLAKAVDYWLDRYDLVHQNSPLFTGIGYTDAHAVLPGKNILAGVAVICALLFFFNAWRRSWLMPSVGLGLMLVSAILLGLIWPAIVQGFQVKPSQSAKEQTYLQDNIGATKAAYGIDAAHVTYQRYAANADPKASAKKLDQEVSSASIVDPGLAAPEFEQTQQGRSFYTMSDPLDTDHYDIDGADRALVLGVRELDQSGISSSDQNWTNLHTVYTHGDGVVAAYANQRGRSDTTEEKTTQYADGVSDGQTHRDLEKYVGTFQRQIYFGEDSPSYSVVGQQPGAAPVELDTTPDGRQTTTTYAGTGGVPIASTFRRLMYAVKFGSANFLLSQQVNADSKVLYDRSPLQRVAKVAPWLTLDSDVYPVIHDGRLLWVVDGYTTTDDYPGSESESFSTMIDDAAQSTASQQTLPTDDINYMRNAVKATVDAYDGTVTLYAWDPSDPILQAWEAAFPGTVQSKIPQDLKDHFRYPEELFKVQRYQLARYHVSDPDDFLDGSQRWQVPVDPNNSGHLETPYRSFIDAPSANPLDPSGSAATATSSQVWSLSSTLVPYQRQNLAALMTVDSDGGSPDYGQITVLDRFSPQTDGPQQVSQAFRTNAGISGTIARFNRSSALPTFGNIMAIPTAHSGLMWIEPVYAYANTGSPSSYPVLADVLAAYDGRVGSGRTLEQALVSALSRTAAGSKPGGSGPPGTKTNPTQTTAARAAQLLSQAQRLFARAERASSAQDYTRAATYNREARGKLAQAARLLRGLQASSTPSAIPSNGTTLAPSSAPSATVSPSA